MAFMIHNALRVNPRDGPPGGKRHKLPKVGGRRRVLRLLQKNTGRRQVFRFPRHGAFDGNAGSGKIRGDTQRGEDPMSTSAYGRIPVIILAALALAACPFKKDKKHDDDHGGGGSTSPTYYVSVSTGMDTNPGTQASKVKTITHAMTVATSGSTVKVDPGIYDVLNNNETFPITVPAGVLLIGVDANEVEANQGGGPSIVGRGPAPAGFAASSVTLLPGTGSTIAVFTNTPDDASLGHDGLLLSNGSVTLRNNTVSGASRYGVEVGASTDHVITGNQIVNNPGQGLGFINGGDRSKVEKNGITGNAFGVEYDVAGGDLGGGLAGSAGGNVITCNTYSDIVAMASTPITINAANNFWDDWDNSSPTRSCNFTSVDICDFNAVLSNAAKIITTGGAQALSPPNPVCPNP